MAEHLEMDSQLFETYHQRMAEIQDVSDVIAVANMQLNKILTQFNWIKQSLLKKNDKEIEKCPIDAHHKVKKDNLQAHTLICSLSKQNISVKRKDLPLQTHYELNSSSVPIFVSKSQYKKVGVEIDDCESMLNEEILEIDDGINCYKPCNSLDQLRFIYSWHKIPQNYIILDITKIPKSELNDWLIEHVSKINLNSHLKQCLINSMLVWLNEFPTPTQMLSHVQDLLGNKSKSFILMLWKFLAAKCLCLNQHIPEHTRNEFDFYTSTSMKNQVLPVIADNNKVRKLTIENFISPALSMQMLFSRLTSEQKLNIYNDICKTWYSLKKPVFGINELKQETQAQEKLLTEFDENAKGQKTHWEILAELRDYKRRRQSYRGKNKSKFMSTLDIVRELLNQQMLYLKLTNENKRVEDERIKIEKVDAKSVTPDNGKRTKSSKDNLDESDQRRSSTRDRDSKRNRSRSRDRRRSVSHEERSRSRSQERKRSKHSRHRDRSRDRSGDRSGNRKQDGSRRRDSRDRVSEMRNKSYY